jgi:hypothetical protein
MIPARPIMRQKLAASGQIRAACWFASALAILAGYTQLSVGLLVIGLLLFVTGLIQALRVTPSTR